MSKRKWKDRICPVCDKEHYYNRSKCRECRAADCKRYRANKPDLYNATHRRYRYKHCHNFLEFEAIWDEVTHCQLCGGPFDDTNNGKKCLDHYNDHVRGIIHNGCNKGLGALGDTPDIVEKAHNYMKERHAAS